MSTRTATTTTDATTMRATGPRPVTPPPKPAQLSVARQVRQQRRGYAAAVLRTLARTHRGRPAAEIQAILRASLAPLGVRLTRPRCARWRPTSPPVGPSNCPDPR